MISRTMEERLTPLPLIKISDVIRFWMKVEKTDYCWVWTGGLYDKRYGRFYYEHTYCCAHRVSWLIHRGQDPGDLLVLHECNNTKCIRPEHLYLGTTSDNQQQAHRDGRHCQYGQYNGNAAFTNDEARKIYQLFPEIGAKELARQHCVDVKTIYNVVNGKTKYDLSGL